MRLASLLPAFAGLSFVFSSPVATGTRSTSTSPTLSITTDLDSLSASPHPIPTDPTKAGLEALPPVKQPHGRPHLSWDPVDSYDVRNKKRKKWEQFCGQVLAENDCTYGTLMKGEVRETQGNGKGKGKADDPLYLKVIGAKNEAMDDPKRFRVYWGGGFTEGWSARDLVLMAQAKRMHGRKYKRKHPDEKKPRITSWPPWPAPDEDGVRPRVTWRPFNAYVKLPKMRTYHEGNCLRILDEEGCKEALIRSGLHRQNSGLRKYLEVSVKKNDAGEMGFMRLYRDGTHQWRPLGEDPGDREPGPIRRAKRRQRKKISKPKTQGHGQDTKSEAPEGASSSTQVAHTGQSQAPSGSGDQELAASTKSILPSHSAPRPVENLETHSGIHPGANLGDLRHYSAMGGADHSSGYYGENPENLHTSDGKDHQHLRPSLTSLGARLDHLPSLGGVDHSRVYTEANQGQPHGHQHSYSFDPLPGAKFEDLLSMGGADHMAGYHGENLEIPHVSRVEHQHLHSSYASPGANLEHLSSTGEIGQSSGYLEAHQRQLEQRRPYQFDPYPGARFEELLSMGGVNHMTGNPGANPGQLHASDGVEHHQHFHPSDVFPGANWDHLHETGGLHYSGGHQYPGENQGNLHLPGGAHQHLSPFDAFPGTTFEQLPGMAAVDHFGSYHGPSLGEPHLSDGVVHHDLHQLGAIPGATLEHGHALTGFDHLGGYSGENLGPMHASGVEHQPLDQFFPGANLGYLPGTHGVGNLGAYIGTSLEQHLAQRGHEHQHPGPILEHTHVPMGFDPQYSNTYLGLDTRQRPAHGGAEHIGLDDFTGGNPHFDIPGGQRQHPGI